MYPIYGVDLTIQLQNISDIKCNIILKFGFNEEVPDPSGSNEGTICYIVLVSYCLLLYKPAKSKIT